MLLIRGTGKRFVLGDDEYLMMWVESSRANVVVMPLQADSAKSRFWRCLGTCCCAKCPFPTTVAARIGSIALKHAAHAIDSFQLNRSAIKYTARVEIIQPPTITGPRIHIKDFQCRSTYCPRSSTATAKHWITRTTRVHSSTTVSRF